MVGIYVYILKWKYQRFNRLCCGQLFRVHLHVVFCLAYSEQDENYRKSTEVFGSSHMFVDLKFISDNLLWLYFYFIFILRFRGAHRMWDFQLNFILRAISMGMLTTQYNRYASFACILPNFFDLRSSSLKIFMNMDMKVGVFKLV